MAILSRHPSFEVVIEMNDNALPEYEFGRPGSPDHERLDAGFDGDVDGVPAAAPSPPTTIIKYVEAPLNGEFTIRYSCKLGFGHSSERIYADISLDGKAILILDIRFSPRDGMDSQVCYGGEMYRDGEMFAQKFRFAELNVGKSPMHGEHGAVTNEFRREMQEYGNIRLDFYFTESGQTVTSTEFPGLEFENFGPLSEKAVQKATAITGDAPTQSASLSATQSKIGGSLQKVRTVGKLGSFIFKYRTTQALRGLGIIAHTPAPTPPRTPTPQKDQIATRVKRERDESVATVAGDDGEVEWVMTQPSEAMRKKQRTLPTAGDEVVSLDD
ncbi:hypothetical protein BU23DRAFT_570718 [Bimuria novae-zelandiae CBS 107.79]|uniref:DUF7918 domain-containing protein n=1 Tax=Bimuria novae-zelandiae CBS 107.79 TaxID=1447943 RepID=A0A6A5V2S5_9PLEO|nr:hypothetical protein BU23DRAFT_570718 [Bimuria novae-zelandiae CBS 107.79]